MPYALSVAFLFQKCDLELLGLKNSNADEAHWPALSSFCSDYVIMGVSLVDIRVWKWLYDHPDATAEELKEALAALK